MEMVSLDLVEYWTQQHPVNVACPNKGICTKRKQISILHHHQIIIIYLYMNLHNHYPLLKPQHTSLVLGLNIKAHKHMTTDIQIKPRQDQEKEEVFASLISIYSH